MIAKVKWFLAAAGTAIVAMALAYLAGQRRRAAALQADHAAARAEWDLEQHEKEHAQAQQKLEDLATRRRALEEQAAQAQKDAAAAHLKVEGMNDEEVDRELARRGYR